ncbi:uncharacterized protein LACBIDRAFT_324502 [Laccaria bicolor S238N-H82]|uniref:Predicted protein n=1 Tax=Laccaria bicolor (strain S238N-H82 / ATCC MYA-4686) TaxID=486041 RepID=B0D210_LACBS|nr:uncharacterized protein LACBIDRAFT_324502 [Laccaria bicolor S238N-H82]EDR12084.1 predicted protein [Laccaria bicolor S238N-H82]|eukprot:XP_001877981.1 predicted protein [Laccaria bicolor S238N-H82]
MTVRGIQESSHNPGVQHIFRVSSPASFCQNMASLAGSRSPQPQFVPAATLPSNVAPRIHRADAVTTPSLLWWIRGRSTTGVQHFHSHLKTVSTLHGRGANTQQPLGFKIRFNHGQCLLQNAPECSSSTLRMSVPNVWSQGMLNVTTASRAHRALYKCNNGARHLGNHNIAAELIGLADRRIGGSSDSRNTERPPHAFVFPHATVFEIFRATDEVWFALKQQQQQCDNITTFVALPEPHLQEVPYPLNEQGRPLTVEYLPLHFQTRQLDVFCFHGDVARIFKIPGRGTYSGQYVACCGHTTEVQFNRIAHNWNDNLITEKYSLRSSSPSPVLDVSGPQESIREHPFDTYRMHLAMQPPVDDVDGIIKTYAPSPFDYWIANALNPETFPQFPSTSSHVKHRNDSLPAGTRYHLLNVRMGRPRKRKHGEWIHVPDSDGETSPPPSSDFIPVTYFHGLATGPVVSSSQTLHIPSSPSQIDDILDVESFMPSQEDQDDEPIQSLSSLLDAFAEMLAIDPDYFDHLNEVSVLPRPKKPSDNALKVWMQDRDRFVSEDICWEGRGAYTSGSCAHCEAEWTGAYFTECSLKKLGLRIQLGHKAGECCSHPEPAFGDDFTVTEVNGIHSIGIDFCNCETAQPHFIQLLRYRWFPSTVTKPMSAATFRVLKHFQLLSFESKASAFEYYSALACHTNNTGAPSKDRYRQFLRMVREYRNIKMLKRFGRGHDPTGTEGTGNGQCAVLCPACPQPGWNLPANWKESMPSQRFLYCLFLAIDANFRLKRKHVSSDEADPSLMDGSAYFVKETEYKSYLSKYSDLIEQPPSTCSNHDAVNKERSGKGLATTGAGTVDCARHDIKRPSSVGDLQKGERVKDTDLVEVVVSYDIACQWSSDIWGRMMKYPHTMHVDHDDHTRFRFLIPKFHLPAHIKACQEKFSFNFNRHVGRTDGEAPERGWSHINPVAMSTREMGPGSRRDTLDDHFGNWNWKKTTLMVAEYSDHQNRYLEFHNGLPQAATAQWINQLTEWEADHSKSNPFIAKFKSVSQDTVRRAMAQEEAEQMITGMAYVMHEAVSASTLIMMGLDIEEQQRRLLSDLRALGLHASDTQKTKLQTRSNVLYRKIQAWIDIQYLYIPHLRVIRACASSHPDGREERPEAIKLWLPSAIAHDLDNLCDMRLLNIEWQLREAQAHDALDELRESLRVCSYLYIDKDRFQFGQYMNTRSRTVISRVQTKVNASAAKYRVACAALTYLAPPLSKMGWVLDFPNLKDGDVHGLKDPEDDHLARRKPGKPKSDRSVPSEGHRTISWIWTKFGTSIQDQEDEGLQDGTFLTRFLKLSSHWCLGLRIEYCKSKARADRWYEEIQLLREEMRRVPQYFQTHAKVWEARIRHVSWSDRFPHDKEQRADFAMVEGRVAYAMQQAAQFRSMKLHVEHLWRFVDEYVKMSTSDVIPPELEGEGDISDNDL